MALLSKNRPRDLGNAINAGAGGYQTVASDDGVLTINLADGRFVQTTLTENVTTLTINLPVGMTAGDFYLRVQQDGTGGFTLAQPTGGLVPGGTTITPSAAADAIDLLHYATFDGGAEWLQTRVGAAFAA